MKVIGINGSPHERGCTYTAIELMAKELEKEKIEVEILQIGKKPFQGCTACNACGKMEDPKCIFGNDLVNECIEKMKNADGIILGSPTYYAAIAGTMKCFLDRFFYAGSHVLKHKVGVAVASQRRTGGVEVTQQINNYFNLAHVVIPPSQYWNTIHGNTPDEAMQDLEGVQIMQTLGKNMAWTLKSLKAGSDQVSLPILGNRVWTNFIR